MTSDSTQVFICSLCSSFCDADGKRVDSGPKFSVPELLVCEVCRVAPPVSSPPREHPTSNPIQVSRSSQVEESTSHGSKRRFSGFASPGATSHRGCPVELEREFSPLLVESSTVPSAPVTPAHSQQVVEFNASASDRDELVLNELRKTFDLTRPDQPGEWVTGLYFLEKFKIKAANSCASRLRGTKSTPGHPFVVANGLDVDSKMIMNEAGTKAEWWAYRLCRRIDSERLAREVKRRKKNGQSQALPIRKTLERRI